MANEVATSEVLDDSKILDILLKENYLTAQDISAADVLAKKNSTSLIDTLVNQELVTKELIGQALAEYYHVPFANLATQEPQPSQVLILPEEVARKYYAVVYVIEDKTIKVATSNPKSEELLHILESGFKGYTVKLAYADQEDIARSFKYYRKSLETRFSKIIADEQKVAPEIVEEIFDDAITLRASDIHLEPHENDVFVRFRIDGVLHEAGKFPRNYYEGIVNRIKVQANMRIDGHTDALDGGIQLLRGNDVVDIRVSIVPVIYGEKIVMRLLSSYVHALTLNELGLSESTVTTIQNAIKKPFGMIIAAGPTGSGKTTTMYSLVRLLNKPEINITTIEDPVEYRIPMVNQIQVNALTSLTYAKGLRSIIRQDPDVVLVGEIRDHETADIALNAALTGQLLFSTFHANDAATGISRMLEIGIEPFLLASTLELLISQRLVRKICTNCRYSHTSTPEALAKEYPQIKRFYNGKTVTVYEGKGCEVCGHTGFKGRLPISEYIVISSAMRKLILTRPTSEAIWELARSEGSLSMFEDGLDKVAAGQTTLDELFRVAVPPEIISKTSAKRKIGS